MSKRVSPWPYLGFAWLASFVSLPIQLLLISMEDPKKFVTYYTASLIIVSISFFLGFNQARRDIQALEDNDQNTQRKSNR